MYLHELKKGNFYLHPSIKAILTVNDEDVISDALTGEEYLMQTSITYDDGFIQIQDHKLLKMILRLKTLCKLVPEYIWEKYFEDEGE